MYIYVYVYDVSILTRIYLFRPLYIIGKSALINRLLGRKMAKSRNLPGTSCIHDMHSFCIHMHLYTCILLYTCTFILLYSYTYVCHIYIRMPCICCTGVTRQLMWVRLGGLEGSQENTLELLDSPGKAGVCSYHALLSYFMCIYYIIECILCVYTMSYTMCVYMLYV